REFHVGLLWGSEEINPPRVYRLPSDIELRAAAAIDPDTAVVVAPRLAEHAVVVAELTSDVNAESRVGGAAMARVVHRLADDELRVHVGRRAVARSREHEVSAASVTDPHAFVAIAPRLPFDASRFAELMHELHAVVRVGGAKVAASTRFAAQHRSRHRRGAEITL